MPVLFANPRKVNGLTQRVITQKRSRTCGDYPLHFIQDPDVPVFCQQVDLAVCHNTPFDTKFLKQAHGYEFPSKFCTMRNFTQYCSIPHPHFRIKWPKLEEAVQIICGRDDFEFHDSLADCYAVLEILKEACFYQLSKFQSKDECREAAEGILDKYNSATLRALLRR